MYTINSKIKRNSNITTSTMMCTLISTFNNRSFPSHMNSNKSINVNINDISITVAAIITAVVLMMTLVIKVTIVIVTKECR